MSGKKIIFDVDGIMVDILSGIANVLHMAAKAALEGGRGTVYKICGWALFDKSQLEDIASYDPWSITDWNLDPLPEHVKKSFYAIASELPVLYSNPIPMFDTIIDKDPAGCRAMTDRRPSFTEWSALVDFVARHAAVEIHTHTYTKKMHDARYAWLHEIFGPESGRKNYRIDCGPVKTQLKGDIVIEDSMDNLLRADCEIRIMHALPFNRLDAPDNIEKRETAGNPEIKIYGTFSELCGIIANMIADGDEGSAALLLDELSSDLSKIRKAEYEPVEKEMTR